MSDRPTFDAVLDRIDGVDGWLTDEQARRLYDRAAELGSGTRLVEIGSFRGRSMIVMASVAADGVDVVAIDPHGGGDRGPQEITPDQTRGDDDHAAFAANLAAAGVKGRVHHVRKMSDAAHDDVPGAIDVLYIDGAHRYGPARRDIAEWGRQVSGGGTMLVHDSFSSIGVTSALLTSTFAGADFRYVGRSGSLAEYRREALSVRERFGNGLRQVAQLPWFARNVLIKILITAKLTPLTRLLGHHGGDWPY